MRPVTVVMTSEPSRDARSISRVMEGSRASEPGWSPGCSSSGGLGIWTLTSRASSAALRESPSASGTTSPSASAWAPSMLDVLTAVSRAGAPSASAAVGKSGAAVRTPMRKLGAFSANASASLRRPRFPTMKSSMGTWAPAAVWSVVGSNAGDILACNTATCSRSLSWGSKASKKRLPTMILPAIILKRGSSRTTVLPSSASQRLPSHIIASICSMSAISLTSASWASKILHMRPEVCQQNMRPATE
mmetsp:Transcript_78028/g.232411  ORF Transcript_78028/g.232411 Transcript_78028/m.232411 type:complete len:247 (-) Transcript_78028:527-1267(-)